MKHLLIVALFFTYQSLLAQDTLRNKTVIDLYKAGLGKTIIISKINASACSFDISTDKLIDLKKAGLPDEILDAMITKSSGTSSNSTLIKQGNNENIALTSS